MEPRATAKQRVCDLRQRMVKPQDDVRRNALARLYARRSAVTNLIDALEAYQREQRRQRATCAAVSDGERSS